MDSPDRGSLDGKKSKSFEEREEEYAVVRRRIFNQENVSSKCIMSLSLSSSVTHDSIH